MVPYPCGVGIVSPQRKIIHRMNRTFKTRTGAGTLRSHNKT
jgi:hypothetical protein